MSENTVCTCTREVLNRKKLILAMRKKNGPIFLCALVTAFVFIGIYFVKHHVLPQNKTYCSESIVQIEYKRGEEEPLGWVCYTLEAWKVFVTSDEFTESVLETLGGEVTREEYFDSIGTMTLPDGRVLHIGVNHRDPKMARKINAAMIKAVDEFGNTQERILWTKMLTAPQDGKEVISENRVLQAGILGALLGGIFSFLFFWYRLLGDDSMYLEDKA